jgi:ABC-type transport system substrate-binding protein
MSDIKEKRKRQCERRSLFYKALLVSKHYWNNAYKDQLYKDGLIINITYHDWVSYSNKTERKPEVEVIFKNGDEERVVLNVSNDFHLYVCKYIPGEETEKNVGVNWEKKLYKYYRKAKKLEDERIRREKAIKQYQKEEEKKRENKNWNW